MLSGDEPPDAHVVGVEMNHEKLPQLFLLWGSILSAHSIAAAVSDVPVRYDQKTLAQVQALYGIDENAAISRLGKEYDAAVLARHVEGRNLPGYAGAWFDSDTLGLVVATSQIPDFDAIVRVGATPTLVRHNLTELDAVRDQIVHALQSEAGANGFRDAAVDIQTNAVLVEVVDKAFTQASALVQTLKLRVPVRLIPVEDTPYGFSSSLRGADQTRNDFTPQVPIAPGHFQSCSVGASAEKVSGSTYTSGFATAGHCGILGNTMYASDQSTVIGYMQHTTQDFYVVPNSYPQRVCYAEPSLQDGAWVQTVSPWIALSQINGYSDGNITVSGTWAGMLRAPVGTTVCRYGTSSDGPHCGQVSAWNATVVIPKPQYSSCSDITLNGMIKVHGTCTEDGDSGGPLVMPIGQVQGTDTGSLNTHVNACTIDHRNFDVYFQPITTTLATAGTALGSPIAMLTTHGRSAPTVANFRCPDPTNSGVTSGVHVYTCNFTDFDSQGETTMSWTTNTGASGNDVDVSGTCSTGQTVNVTLAISNPYGTTTKPRSFTCPNYPMP